ncbi:MAG: hypothetical protein M5U34_29180 [Chloroflexi bacterium]|nr:hypothetical protein [Chloroflexota bacterium]
MKTAVKQALLVYLAARLILLVWSILAPLLIPAPTTPDPVLRPYLGQPHFTSGVTGLLLGPWQRFDTQRYLRIAAEGYAHEEDSVFPPLYPLATRALGLLFGGGAAGNLWATTLISNLAFIGLLILLYIAAEYDLGAHFAPRTPTYLTFFPPASFYWRPTPNRSLFFWLWLRYGRRGITAVSGWLAYSVYWRRSPGSPAGCW